MADIHKRGLTRSNSGILKSSEYSDMIVRCGSEEIRLHRAIVCPRSKFFAAACNGQFQEAKTSTIVLEEDDLPSVRRMLIYLYTLAYDDEGEAASAQHYTINGKKLNPSRAPSTPLSAEKLLRHTKMMNNVVVHAIAQKYDIGELKQLAAVKFQKLLWLEAPSHGLPDIIDAVFETTSVTDPELRNIAVDFCAHYNSEIVADDHLCSMIKDQGELGLQILRKVQGKLAIVKGELAQMISDASSITLPPRAGMSHMFDNAADAMARLQQKLKGAHDTISK